MSVAGVFLRLFLPLLTQETGIMVSTFTYGIKEGVASSALVGLNTIAVMTDLAIFFVPAHFLSHRLHAMLVARFQERYETGRRAVCRFGDFRTAAVLGFVMPSVAAMIVVGLLRLSFWRALAGLFVGSAIYVFLPLLVALPLAATLPNFLLPVLQWAPLTLFGLYVLVVVARWQLGKRKVTSPGT